VICYGWNTMFFNVIVLLLLYDKLVVDDIDTTGYIDYGVYYEIIKLN